jgi:hypothetical protein
MGAGSMGDLKFPFFKTVAGIFQPICVILILEIFPKEGTSAFCSKQTSL